MKAVIPEAQHVGQQLASVMTSGCFLPFSFSSIIFRYLRVFFGWAIQVRGSLIQQDPGSLHGFLNCAAIIQPGSNLILCRCAEKHETQAESNQGVCDKVLHVARDIALNLVENILPGIWKSKSGLHQFHFGAKGL